MPNQSVAIVTGGNRGLGLETCRQLAISGRPVLLTARNEEAGQAASDTLRKEGLDVSFHPLDVTNTSSIETLAHYLREQQLNVEILVNNAGVFPDPSPADEQSSIFHTEPETVIEGFVTNTLGPLRLCQALIPLMAEAGRIVNISSGMGQLSEMNGCCPAYRLSKTALNAVTRILADELKATGIKVNSVCPGWVRTAMGGEEATLSIPEGVKGILWAATLPENGPSGGFFRHGEKIDW